MDSAMRNTKNNTEHLRCVQKKLKNDVGGLMSTNLVRSIWMGIAPWAASVISS